jgi:prepilin-type N-terminal cleavage/methylation domain-containing protein
MVFKETVTRPFTRGTGVRLNSGFTLIELLVSMTIVGFLMLAILFGFRIGTNAWAKGETGMERIRTAQATFDLLNRQLGSMVEYISQQKMKDSIVKVLVFQGSESGMRFVTTFSSQSRGAGGLHLVEYFVSNSKQGDHTKKALVLNETILPDDATLARSVIHDISLGDNNFPVVAFREFAFRSNSRYLIDDLESIQFSYTRPESRVPTTPGLRRDSLPEGIGIRLRWDEPGLLGTRDLSITVPVQVFLEQ